MYKVGDYVIYEQYVCQVENIIPKFFNGNDYFNLKVLNEDDLEIKAPTNNLKLLRPIISSGDLDELIKKSHHYKLLMIKIWKIGTEL